MYTYRAPHTTRAIAEAFQAGNKDLGYKLMHENQIDMDRRTALSGQFHWYNVETFAEGAEVTMDIPVVAGVWNLVRPFMFPEGLVVFVTGGTYTFDPAPDDGFLTTNTTAVWQGSTNFAMWNTTQTVRFKLASGWTRSSGSGNVNFTRFAVTHGLSLADEDS